MTGRTVEVPGGRIHLVEEGEGPLVLLIHGFPESSRSWRRQLPAIAAAGRRAVAIDVRGYGGSSAPSDPGAYGMLDHVSDAVGVVEALGHRTATVIGHDWGAAIAANAALVRPDAVTAVGMLGVPYAPRGGPRPSEVFRAIGGPEEFYVSYLQEPGRAEAEIVPDPRAWVAGFYAALSGDAPPTPDGGSVFFVPPGRRMSDRFPPADRPPPAWLGDDDLDGSATALAGPGVTPALNRYRSMDRDWEDLAPWDGAPIPLPSLFVAGERDASIAWLRPAIEAFPATLPGLVSSHIVEGAGHWVHQERPDEVNRILVEWLARTPASP